MKAAVLKELGTIPTYCEFPTPTIQNEGQVLMHVKASALKNLDKVKTRSDYYAPYQKVPVVIGTDGVGALEDGTNVYSFGISGMMAQKALIKADNYTVIPSGLDLSVAAALPNAVLGSAIPMTVRADIKPGDVVFINGATGITGMVAVQIAKHYGASKVIVTGRNEERLENLKSLGADVVIPLNMSDKDLFQKFKEIDVESPIDIVIDYIWGMPAELLIRSFENRKAKKISFVTLGDMAGKTLTLSSNTLRSADISLLGSGFGSLTPQLLEIFGKKILPEMFALAADGKLKINTETRNLKEIEDVWLTSSEGKRMVMVIDSE